MNLNMERVVIKLCDFEWIMWLWVRNKNGFANSIEKVKPRGIGTFFRKSLRRGNLRDLEDYLSMSRTYMYNKFKIVQVKWFGTFSCSSLRSESPPRISMSPVAECINLQCARIKGCILDLNVQVKWIGTPSIAVCSEVGHLCGLVHHQS